jgi:hypothetical protein
MDVEKHPLDFPAKFPQKKTINASVLLRAENNINEKTAIISTGNKQERHRNAEGPSSPSIRRTSSFHNNPYF